MVALSPKRILLLGIAGALGGLVAFFVVNPSLVAIEEGRAFGEAGVPDAQAILAHDLFFGLAIGLAIGGALVLAEEAVSGRVVRLAVRLLIAAAVGATAGAIGSVIGELAFSILLLPGRLSAAGPGGPTLILARTVGWSLMGAAAGICPGAAAGSWRRLAQGALGGLLGGAAGGLAFDVLGQMTGGGTTSRLVGLGLMGLAIGVAVSVVEELAKRFWLTGLTGAREGRSYILAKPRFVIGRSELADVPVFGDPSVLPQHAGIAVNARDATLIAAPGALVTVNQQPVATASLRDGDILGIGRHVFRFRARAVRGAAPLPPLPPEGPPVYAVPPDAWAAPAGPPTAPYAPPGAPAYTVPPEAGVPPAAPVPGTLTLAAVAGPHAGQTFAVGSVATIGREGDCAVLLDRDMRVSRRHARLALGPQGWQVEDMGSTNGTWVNGQRVAGRLLLAGDQVAVGDTVLAVG